MVSSGPNADEAIIRAKDIIQSRGIDAVEQKINESIAKNGISPRYTGQPEPKVKKITEPSYATKSVKRVNKASKEGILPAVITPDKKKVETVPVQVIGGSGIATDPVEQKIFVDTEVDGSVKYTEARKKYLNYDNGKWYHDVNYFSGDIYQKLEDLEANKQTIISQVGKDQYTKQKDGLEAIRPKPVVLKEITFDPLDRYVTQETVDEDGTKVLDQFVRYINDNQLSLSYGVNKYDVRNYVQGFRASPGTKNIMGSIKADSARLFNYFVREILPSEVQNKIVAKFNREKNSYVNPDYSKIPVEIKDMARFFRGKEFKLSQTQANGVSFLNNKGVGLVAYGVGVGKTHTMLTATMVAKQRGWTKRPTFIVPKSTLTKAWIGTIKSMFPNDTIVNLGGLNKPDVNRISKLRGTDPKKWIKDGEVVVMTHEGLLRLGLTSEQLNDAVSDLTDALSSQSEETARQQEVATAKIQEIVGKAQYKAGEIMISDLGIDHISVDEVHNFRKIFQGAKPEALNPDGSADKSKTRRFGNVIGGTPSKQAQQLFLISQHILKNNNNRGVYLASATPFENHATEVYNILSLVARDRLKKIGIFNINDFFALFSNFETELEKNVRGEWVNKEKMKSFKNLPQLQKILREFVDYQVDPTLVRPERRVFTPQLQMSELQADNLALIQEMLSPKEGRKPEEGAVLKASTYSVANSISPYFIKEYHPEIVTPEELIDNSPKLKYSMEILKNNLANPKTAKYGTFLYIGANGIEYHDAIAEYAVKHLGLKPAEVAVINGSTSNDEREAIKDGFNDGSIKFLVGGDPTKEGIDLQNNGYTTINVALGWNPTEPNQVEGRVWRQGNKRSIAPLIYPLVENSGDITVYNKFEEKGGRINDLFSYQGQIFDIGELDPREKKLALMTNPEDKAAIEIEMDKAGLQNKLMMLQTDINTLNRFDERMISLEDNINRNNERITSGISAWGGTLTPEQIANYRKENTKLKRDLANMQEKLDLKGIKDITQEVMNLTKQKEEVNIEIGKITETFKDRLAKFQREQEEMIANRKSIEDLVADFNEKTKDLVELTDEQIATQKEKLMKELEQKQILDNDMSRYKAPSGNADKGGYAEIDPSEVVIDRIRSIQFPELTAMVKELTGSVPKVQALRGALGRMYEKGEGIIKLNPAIFSDPVQATKVLAHEIGHLADYIPEHLTTRGNLIGHIASLNKFMKGKYMELENKEIKTELKNLTQLWKPFKEDVSPNYTKYRYSAKELYADAVSVLLNKPELLQQVAPKFYDGFFEYINSKPNFEKVYFETLDLLNQGEEVVNNKRLEEIYEGFREAREKRINIEEEVKPQKSWWERFMRNHVTKFDPIYRQLGKVNIGVVESSKQRVREALEIMQMRRNDQAIFLDKITTEITDALEKIGMSEDDLGVVLKLEREAMGDRTDIANPGGLIGKIPETLLTHWYKTKNLTPEQIKVFEQIKTRFHELIFKETERAVANGNFNKKVFKEKIEPNKNTYATFSVVDYIHKNYISAGIKKQTGTLSRIENPFTSSVLKTTALIDWNNIQEAKQVIVGELTQYFPDDVKPAKAVRTNKGTVIRFQKEDGKETLEMMKNGAKIGFNVDPYIKSMFENDNLTADEVHQLVVISRSFNRLFKPLVTTYNLSWGFYSNIVRDIKRTYISLGSALNKFAQGKKSLSVGELLVTWVKSIPEGARFASGNKTDLIKEMLADKALTTSWSQYDPNANNDSSIAFLLRQHKLIGKEETSTFRKAWNNSFGRLLEAIQFAGGTFEATTKIAGYQITKKRDIDGKRLGFIVRNYVGTPNYIEGGAWKQVDNNVFVFSNVMAQATRTSLELATDPKTASGYWMRTFMVGVLPKLLMAAGLAGLFGDWVKKNLERQSEYDKTNYITIPVGFDENGKAIYMRVPQDETERFVSAIVWKVMSGWIQGKLTKPEQVLSIGAGYIPGVTPIWTFLGDWLGYTQGRNPYDSYRGRLAIDETSWKAGGLIRLGKMVQYSMNTIGLGNFKTYDSSNKSTLEVITDRIPVLNRMFQISDYGLQEQFSSTQDQEAAIKSIKRRELIDKYVKSSRGADSIELRKIQNDMLREYFGHIPTGDEKTEANLITKKFLIQREKGSSPYMDKLIFSNTNAEKIEYLTQFKKTLDSSEYNQLVKDATKYKIIGPDVVKEIKKLKSEVKTQPTLAIKFPDFNIIKEAYAAEDFGQLSKKMIWNRDDRTKFQLFLAWVSTNFIPGVQDIESPIEGITSEKISDMKKYEYWRSMAYLKKTEPEWYFWNIGERTEQRILGGKLEDQKIVDRFGKYTDVTDNITPITNENKQKEIIVEPEKPTEKPKQILPNRKVQPAKGTPPITNPDKEITLKDGTKATVYATPYDDILDREFGDKADEARRVLNNDGSFGENPSYNPGKGWVNPDGSEQDINYQEGHWGEKGYEKYVSSVTGAKVTKDDPNAVVSRDLGLMRINNGTFYDFMHRANRRKQLEEIGVTKIEDLYDPEKNIKVAKINYDEGGWGRWYAAPDDLK